MSKPSASRFKHPVALGAVGRAATARALPALLLLVAALPAAAPTGRALTQDSSPASASQVKEDAKRLLTFRETLDNGASLLPDWKGDDPCGWTGITCDASGLVQKINLVNRGLEGQFAPWPLPSALQELLLSYNKIRGPIPKTMLDPDTGSPTPFTFPPALARLFLDHNLLTGSIVPLQLPAKLSRLSLEGNQLEGSLPVGWTLPDGLQALYLGNNRLKGTIPSNFYLPGKLEILDLSHNSLYGELPNSWALQPSLALLFLNDNNLQGTLPAYTSAPNAIIYVSPGNPKLCGPVPKVPLYYYFDSSRSQIAPDALPACPGSSSDSTSTPPTPSTGTIRAASDQATLDLLQRFRSTFSNAVGENMALDDWFKQLWPNAPERASNPCDWTGIQCNMDSRGVEYIQFLYLWDVSPELEGTIPSDGWELPAGLEQFRIDTNKIKGTLPSNWKLPETLTSINLGSNFISGTIPPQPLGNAGQVYLQNNKLAGSLPTFTTVCPTYVIQPGNDDLCGEVPKCPLYQAEYGMDLTPLKPCSSLPPTSSAPTNADIPLLLKIKESFSNGDAKLTGWKSTAPPPCEKNSGWQGVVCREDGTIKTLGLFALGLEGSIPSTGWELPAQVEVLQLSDNSLSGLLPTQWTLPAKLSTINLEGNKFSGPLPYWPAAVNVKVSITPGNADLCGKAPDSPEYWDLTSVATRIFNLPKTCPEEPIRVQDIWKLLILKQSFENGEEVLTSWVPTPGAPCNWEGVRCNGDLKVDTISLVGKGLKSTLNPARLSPDTGLPDTLVYFSLANNDVTGSLSATWGLPATLEFLDLSGCKLVGSIPQDWEPLLPKRLSQMFLHGNQLTGSLPSWPARTDLLVYVKPKNDKLCGAVPGSPKYMDFRESVNEDPIPLTSLNSCP